MNFLVANYLTYGFLFCHSTNTYFKQGDLRECYPLLQIVVAVLSLSLNMMRDCMLDREEYAYSATFLSYFSLSAVTAISFLNIIISAFEPFSLVY